MKYFVLIIILFLISTGALTAQNAIGIGTQNPQGVLHVDPNKNTIGSIEITDDVIVDSDGNVGIGKTPGSTTKLDILGNSLVVGNENIDGNASVSNHIQTNQLKFYNTPLTTPRAKLDIEANGVRTGFRLKNGTEAVSIEAGDTKKHIPILATDENNNVYWQNLPNAISQPVTGAFKTSSGNPPTNATTVLNTTGSYQEITTTNGRITLGTGYWLISAKIVIGNGAGYGTYEAKSGDSGYGGDYAKHASIFLCLGEPGLNSNANAITGSCSLGETTPSYGICILQFTYLYHVPAGTKTLALYLRTDYLRSSQTYKIYSSDHWSEPYFSAVRLN